MPELPEVETVCRSLRPHLIGRRIDRVEVLQPRLRTRVAPDLAARLQGKIITAVDRRAKYILIHLEEDAVWLFHLGMSGKLIHVGSSMLRQKHDHIVVALDGGTELRYHDPRRFGLSLVVQQDQLNSLPQLRHLGPDPLGARFSGAHLYASTRASARRIRDLLLDQQVVAGLGNIYANEILFRTGIRPTTRAWRLTRRQVAAIAATTPKLLRDAIRWCGTSFSDYRDADDKRGEFQNHLRVYDRDGEKCWVCSHVIKRVAIGNRSAFYCPTCQK
jgi:formamidopyrimidine-DNA glycosylase